MSDEEHRSSFASTPGGGWPLAELQVPASGLIEATSNLYLQSSRTR
jgi:hypothetical protein